MSFIITLHVREGIVMAADSRLTLNQTQGTPPSSVSVLAVAQSDANYKLFVTPNGVGISTFGAADIAGVPLAGYVESFIASTCSTAGVSVSATTKLLLAYFSKFSPLPSTDFHVAGYDTASNPPEQQLWLVSVAKNVVKRLDVPGQQGANWGGEADILARLIQPVQQLDPSGKPLATLPYFQVLWPLFTLQDAIDFASFAVRATIDAIRFQPRPKTVGGPIDLLVIKPDGPQWIARKKLHAPTP
jgi:hypothetical protein